VDKKKRVTVLDDGLHHGEVAEVLYEDTFNKGVLHYFVQFFDENGHPGHNRWAKADKCNLVRDDGPPAA
jgi:hypothetical protein